MSRGQPHPQRRPCFWLFQSNMLIQDHPAPFGPSFHPHPYFFLSNYICLSASEQQGLGEITVQPLNQTQRQFATTGRHRNASQWANAQEWGRPLRIADTHANTSMNAMQWFFSAKHIFHATPLTHAFQLLSISLHCSLVSLLVSNLLLVNVTIISAYELSCV